MPSFSMMPARITEPPVGASTWASGSQVWNGNIGTFTANARKKAKNSSIEIRNDGQNLIRSTGTDGHFAYQAIVGAAFPIAAVPGLAITAEYRFTGVGGNSNFKGQYFAPGVATRAVLRESDQYNHSAMLGVRYAFNAAPPPPPEAPKANEIELAEEKRPPQRTQA